MADVFLSYKREDRPIIEKLAGALESEGLSVWWDTELPLGKNYAASISKELTSANVVMPVWTAKSITSDWVQEEATVGKQRGNLIPVKLEAVAPPIGFGMIQTADLSAWTPGDAGYPEWIRLVESIKSTVNGVPASRTAAAPAPVPIRPKKTSIGLVMASALVALLAAGGLYAFLSIGEPNPVIVKPEPQIDDGGISYATAQKTAVNDFAFSPDGKTAVSGGNEGTVRLLDAATGKELKFFGGFGPRVLNVAYSKTSNYVTVAGSDNSITIVELATGKESGRFMSPGDVTRMGLAPDDGSAATLTQDNKIHIFQIDGVPLTDFASRQNADVHGIAWCPESDCLLVFGKQGMLEVWNPFKPELVDSLRGHSGAVLAAAFSSDGKFFATAADDRQVILWNAQTGGRMNSLSGLNEVPLAIAWSRDGSRIAVEGETGKAFVWSTAGGEPRIVGPKQGLGKGWIAFTPDSKSVVLGGGPEGPRSVRLAD